MVQRDTDRRSAAICEQLAAPKDDGASARVKSWSIVCPQMSRTLKLTGAKGKSVVNHVASTAL